MTKRLINLAVELSVKTVYSVDEMDETEIDLIKIEPDIQLNHDDDSGSDAVELDKVPFLRTFIERMGEERDFYIGEEEVDLSSAHFKDDLPPEFIYLDTSDESDLEVENIDDQSATFNSNSSDTLAKDFDDNYETLDGVKKRFIEFRFKCSFCPQTFRDRSYFQYHERCHTGEKPFACDECPMKFTLLCSLKRHKKSHSGEKPFECEICSKRFSTVYNLRMHSSTHSDERPFACDLCAATFKRNRALRSHKKTHEQRTDQITETIYLCEECQMKFPSIGSLNRHKQNHFRVRRFRCVICSVDFSIRHLYMEHMNEYHCFKCEYCPRKFQRERDLNTHTAAHLNQVALYQCEYCFKKLACKSSLTRHKLTHSNDKPHQCSLCQKTFRLHAYLVEHMKIHNGGKIYNCIHCSKTFRQRSRLEIHKRSHLNETFLNKIKPEIISLSDED